MTTPRRIQRHRTKGWRLPAYAVTVTRPGPWGNPFKAMRTPAGWVVTTCTSYRTTRTAALADEANATGPFPTEIAATRAAILAFRRYHDNEMSRASIRKHLQGKVLACWCKPGAACHADVLLEYANDSTPTTCGQRPADATAGKAALPAPRAPRNAAPATAPQNSDPAEP